MSALCDYCQHSRPVHSENGLHYVCTFSAKRQERCWQTERFFKEHIVRRLPKEDNEARK